VCRNSVKITVDSVSRLRRVHVVLKRRLSLEPQKQASIGESDRIRIAENHGKYVTSSKIDENAQATKNCRDSEPTGMPLQASPKFK
jgi:hypothetical protein